MKKLETGKSALVGILWAIAVKYAEYLPDELAWQVWAIWEPQNLESFVKEVWIWIGAGGGGAAWWRSRNPIDKGFDVQPVEYSAPTVVESPVSPVIQSPVVVNKPGNNFKFGTRSLNNLETCHPDLVKVAYRALELARWDFTVICGVRTVEQQKVLYSTGKSKTMNSRHLPNSAGKSRAIDFMVIGAEGGTWVIEPYYREVATAFKQAAKELGISIVSGYDWADHWDSGHVELDRAVYPDEMDVQLA